MNFSGDPRLDEIIQRYLERDLWVDDEWSDRGTISSLADPQSALGMCGAVTHDFLTFAREHGLAGHDLQSWALDHALAASSDSERIAWERRLLASWLYPKIDPVLDEAHTAAVIHTIKGHCIVDFTASQFGVLGLPQTIWLSGLLKRTEKAADS
jgi:hypothetical protein